MIPDATASATTAPMKPQPSSKQALSSDFETFLKMLTAQARYQDPLEPIDSTEYAAQLAQFSMVEQQVQTNDTLSALFAQLGVQNAASLSAWVGMEARADAPAYFNGDPVTVSAAPNRLADQATLIVRNADGAVVQRLSLPMAEGPVLWTGLDDTGAMLPSGEYSFDVESRRSGEVIETAPGQVYSRVVEAQIDGTSIILQLEGGATVPAASVTALRAPA